MSARVLVVDDDVGYGRALARSLERKGHEVSRCVSASEARTLMKQVAPEVVILDYQLPDADGLELMAELKPAYPSAVFLLNTAYPDLDIAVEAMRRGAFDYVAKDAELRECLMRVERASEVARLRRTVVEASEATIEGEALIGDSPAMKTLRKRLTALAASDDTTAFIVGETGVGKGVVARRIHAKSGRAFEPLVAVDCATIPATLVESELFGHEKGAFSGATHSKSGRVEVAARGTLFLDEIGELELPMQTKLLRLLEEREFTRVGSTKARRLEARVITATNRNLSTAVAEGRFRADLRYRLEVFVLEVPPLRERGDDVFILTEHFIRERSRALGRGKLTLNNNVISALGRYAFPGNVRELRNMLEQAVLLAEGSELTLDEFPVLQRAARRQPVPTSESLAPAGAPPRTSEPNRESGMPEYSRGYGTHGTSPVSPWFNPTTGEREFGRAPRQPGRGRVEESSEVLGRAPMSEHGSYALQTAQTRPESRNPRDEPRTLSDAPGLHDRQQGTASQAPGPDGGPQSAERRASQSAATSTEPAPSLDTIRRRHGDQEKARLVAALEESGGNVASAARTLGLSRYQVLRRLSKYGLR